MVAGLTSGTHWASVTSFMFLPKGLLVQPFLNLGYRSMATVI